MLLCIVDVVVDVVVVDADVADDIVVDAVVVDVDAA